MDLWLSLSSTRVDNPQSQPLRSFSLTSVIADYWILTIAISTYLLVANHTVQSAWIKRHRWILWVLPWFFSLLDGVLGLELVGYGFTGAYCLFVKDRTRLFVNYIPRWLIILTVLFLYLRLYLLIHHIRKEVSSFDSHPVVSPEANLEENISVGGVDSSSSLRPNDCEKAPNRQRKASTGSNRLRRVGTSFPTVTTSDTDNDRHRSR